MELASTLLSEHCFAARNSIRLVVQWFTFAITANVIVGGWFVVQLLDGKAENLPIILTFAISLAFVFSNILGIISAFPIGDTLEEHHDAVQQIIKEDGIVSTATNPIPYNLYKKVTGYFAWALIGTSLVWIIGLVAVFLI